MMYLDDRKKCLFILFIIINNLLVITNKREKRFKQRLQTQMAIGDREIR